MKAHKRRKQASILEHYKYNILFSCITGILVIIMCISIFSIVVANVDVSNKWISVISSICLGVGSYTSGYISAIKRQKSGILSGLLCGIVISIIMLTFSNFFVDTSNANIINKISKISISIVCSIIGGIKSANTHNA